MKDSRKPEKGGLAVAAYLDLGLRFALAIAIGTGGGYWLDTKLGTTPLFLIIGLFIGATSGFVTIYRAVYAPPSKEKKENKVERES